MPRTFVWHPTRGPKTTFSTTVLGHQTWRHSQVPGHWYQQPLTQIVLPGL